MKTKKSIINAVFSLVSTVIVSFLSLVSTNLILKCYGSDFNGVVATASQLINILLLLEGGITTATNFALYKPYLDNDYETINAILTKTYKQFVKIGILLFVIGLFLSIVYPFFIKSDLSYSSIMLIILMVISATSFNILFTTKYNVLFQATQNEYYLTLCSFIANLFTYILTIVLVLNDANMLLVRFNIMIGTFINGILVWIVFKHKFPLANYQSSKTDVHYSGVKDILIQKFTSVAYNTAPLMFMSSFVGTIYTSVYAVYNSIFSIIRNIMYSVISAPSNGFGQMISSDEKSEKVYDKFVLYQFIITLILTCLLSSVLSVIIPFIALYTKSVVDVSYIDYTIAILFTISIYTEIVHCPSGTIIGVSGRFRVGRNIQVAAMLFLIPSLVVGCLIYNLYGIMYAILLTGILLAFLEISYVHRNIFKKSALLVVKIIFVNLVLIFLEYGIWSYFNLHFNGYLFFLLIGMVIFITNSLLIFIINWLFFPKLFGELKNIISNFIKKNK